MSTGVLNLEVAPSVLSRANPLAKLVAAVLLTCAVIFSVDWVSAAVVLVGEVLLLPLLRISPARVLARLWPLVLAAVVAAYGTALLAPKTGAVVLHLGPIVMTTSSLAAGAAIGLRALALGIPGYLLITTTDPSEMAAALTQRLHLPQRFVLSALAAMRLVGLLVEQWQTLAMARRARGVGADNSWWRRMRNFGGQLFALLVLALRRATALATAMQARGFGTAPRTWLHRSTFSALDVWVVGYAVVVAVLAVALAVFAGTWHFIGLM